MRSPTVTLPRRAFAIACLAILSLAGPALSQEEDDGHRVVPLSDLLENPARYAREGNVAVDLREPNVSGRRVSKANVDMGAWTLYLEDASDSTRLLQSARESPNIRLYGDVRSRGDRYWLVIDGWRELGSDTEVARQRLDEARANQDVEALFRLEEEMRESPELGAREVAEEAGGDALDILRRRAEGDADQLLDLALEYDRRGNSTEALSLLTRVMEMDALHPRLAEISRRLGAIRYGGEWRTREDVRREEGFVRGSDGGWTTPVREAFEDAVGRRGTRPGRENPRALLAERRRRELVEMGRIQEGMSKREVARAIGFPERVDRITAGDTLFEQWVYPARDVILYFDHMPAGIVLFEKGSMPE